jgi:heme/copper-type cytochrome/quinol oxidase subunit 2
MKSRAANLLALGALVVAAISLLPIQADAMDNEVIVPIEASQYAYEPNVIEVSLGQRVVLELSSSDVVHGIYLDGYDLEVITDPGQTARLSFIADQPGTFRLRCSVTCGPLHPFMIGQLKVEPNPKVRRIVGGSLSALLVGIALAWRNER